MSQPQSSTTKYYVLIALLLLVMAGASIFLTATAIHDARNDASPPTWTQSCAESELNFLFLAATQIPITSCKRTTHTCTAGYAYDGPVVCTTPKPEDIIHE